MLNLLFVLLVSFASLASADPPKSVVHQEGAFVLKQLVTPDFDNLPADRKIFAYHLANAIEAGRDIMWIQNSREGLALRNLLEGLWKYNEHFDQADRQGLMEYMFRVYRYQGNYSDMSNQKFVPDAEKLSPRRFYRMIGQAERAARRDGQSPGFLAEGRRLHRTIFDINYKKIMRAPESPEGTAVPTDVLRESAVNFYGEGFGAEDYMKLRAHEKNDIVAYPEKGPGWRITVRKNRIGDRFDYELRVVDHHFELAKKYATDAEKGIISALQKALHTGNSDDIEKAEILWVQNKSPDIDFAIGFIETYMDPKQQRATFEGTVLLRRNDPKIVKRVKAMRENAPYFESMMPVDDEFRKKEGFEPPQAESAYLVYVGGDSAGLPYLGKNLPNSGFIREKFGSKSWGSYNVQNDIGGVPGDDARIKAFYLPKYQEAFKRFKEITDFEDIQVEFHEILGHGSGRHRTGIIAKQALQSMYGPLEEARAETASLYHFMDPKVMEFGIIPQMDAQEFELFKEVVLVNFFSGVIRGYVRQAEVAGEDSIGQDHRWARQVMLNQMIADGALRVVVQESVPVVEIVDVSVAKKTLGRLWREIQFIISTGDLAKGRSMFQSWGKYHKEQRQWRDLVVAKNRELKVPTETVYLNPRFAPKTNGNGQVVDVELIYEDGRGGLKTLFDRQVNQAELNLIEKGRVCGPNLGSIR
jgi:dipeptidyl-peptidase III